MMDFNISDVLTDMLSAMKGSLGEHWEEAKSTAEEMLRRKEQRLELIAQLRMNGDLDDAGLKEELADEKLIFEAELKAISVISKAMAQRAVNAALDVLTKAIETALSSL